MEITEKRKLPGIIPGGINVSKWPWWAIVLGLVGVSLVFLILGSRNYQDTFLYLTQGIIATLRITFFSFLLASVIGLPTGLARISKNTFLRNIATLYIEIARGIPLLVLIIYIAYGLFPVFVNFINGFGKWGLTLLPVSGFFQSLSAYTIRNVTQEGRAIIALGIGYGAFEAEVFRAGIQSISKGQLEAARSVGMTYFQAMRFIVLPQAIRRVLPPLGNDFIACLKDSSLVSVLAVNELTQMGRLRTAGTFRAMETYNMVAFLYLSMTLVLSTLVRWLENRMKIEE
ncbi:MAG TPA: amino acid ABC transporter permease [Anaerolineales bacterium]